MPKATVPAAKNQLSLTQNVRKTVLENGLTVLTKEVHTAPVVSVQVWYKVGSRDEPPGLNGISHQLEHLMFKGTKTRPIQFGRLLSALGSDFNAFTSYDKTTYFATAERSKLEALLTLEADRMQNALINAAALASEKRVVISELQGDENYPEYRLDRLVMRATFPNSAYGLPIGGTKAEVERFTVEQLKNYYHTYYSPDNATLVIVGDFQTDAVLAAVKDRFGNIPKTQASTEDRQPVTSQPILNKESVVLRETGSASLLEVVYPLPDINHPDVAALDVMDYILTSGRSCRIYQTLVESGLASNASGYALNLVAAGWYGFDVTASPGQDLKKIERILQQAIAQLQNQGVTPEELKRAKTQLQADAILESRDVTSQAYQLGDNQTISGDYRFTDRYLAAIAQVSAQDVQRVAKEYLKPEYRTVGFFEPTTITEEESSADSNFRQTIEDFSPDEPVDPAEVAQYLPAVAQGAAPSTQPLPEEFTLKNGLRVLLLIDRSTPTVSLSGYLQAGSAFDPIQQAGLAHLTAENLMNGTQTKDALTLAKILEDRGASLGFYPVREGTYFGGSSLSGDLPILVQTVSDVLQQAIFPPDQLELSRQRVLSDLQVALDDPDYLAQTTFRQSIYLKNHPFSSFPTLESLKRITRNDILRFYQEQYRPDTMILTLMGDFDAQQVRSLLEGEFENWQVKGKPPTLNFPPVALPEKIVRLNPVLPNKSQSVTYMGSTAIARQDPRYYPAIVLNQILGGDTLSSRLGTEIRDRQGLTYGITSDFQAGINGGSFAIGMQTSPEDTQNAIAATLALLKQIQQEGVTRSEVNAAKQFLTNQYPVSLANPDNLAGTILENAVYKLDRSELREYISKVNTVTLEQVNQAAKELLHPDHLVIVTAGSAVPATP
ncbi:MAG: insulinase family protein [Kastovskya adunca ATA6-11-RM4]|nr:insulinase family protein [Kastovskya adunca ATA6-11-RM4]